MAEVVVLPATIAAAGYQRIAADLSAAIASGQDLGSRKLHIMQIDGVLEQMLQGLEAELSRFPANDPMVRAFRAHVEEFMSLTGTIRAMARTLTFPAHP